MSVSAIIEEQRRPFELLRYAGIRSGYEIAEAVVHQVLEDLGCIGQSPRLIIVKRLGDRQDDCILILICVHQG
jgi:hypothetical protein